MARQPSRWVWARALSEDEKAAIAERCEAFIATRLKPRFLPEIRPDKFNYPVDIRGRWRGSKYSFVTRYRSGFKETAGEEFDSPFARLDHVDEVIAATRFDVMWHRHNGQWHRINVSVTLEEALQAVESNPLLAVTL